MGLAIFLFSLLVINVFGQPEESLAGKAISRAEDELAMAYEAISEAEAVGANVSHLLARSKVAGRLLAEAKMESRSRNFSEAVYFADLASESLYGLQSEAAELASFVALENGQRLFWTVGGSIFGVLFVMLIGFVGWPSIKKRYVRRVLKMKPEVSRIDEH